jgi:RimJ/RimL family protein N-acetyltransferase
MSDPNLKGDFVKGPAAVNPNTQSETILTGNNVELVPLILDHAPSLFKNLCGPGKDYIYTWYPFENFPNLESFIEHLKILMDRKFWCAFTVLLTDSDDSGVKSKEPVGIDCYLNIVPESRSIEIGHVVFGPKLARTIAATEVSYLMMKYAFEQLHFQRVEWKTNNFNEASKRAALRLGFTHEGVFRKHMISKGRRRDTWWSSCLDDDWFKEGKGGVRESIEIWLRKENFDAEGKQKRKLDEIRENGGA